MWKQQKKLLDNFYKRYGKFRVAAHTQWGWRYFMYPDELAISVLQKDGITDRDIMKDEIVIENDMNMLRMNSGEAIKHEKKLRDNGIAYKKYFSGNKSFHIQTHFKELMKIKSEQDLKLLKKSFLLWLYNFNEDETSKHKLDIQLSGKHLIRLEEAWHPQTGQRKILYNEHQTDFNELPEIVKLHFISEKIKQIQKPKLIDVSVFDKPCLMYLLHNSIEDGRKRAGFILFNNFKQEFSIEQSSKMLTEWYERQQKVNFPKQLIDNYISSYKQHNKAPGCDYIKDFMMSIGKKSVYDNCPCNIGETNK